MASTSTNSTFLPRLILSAAFILAVFTPNTFQHILSALYARLYRSSFYQLSTFETIETVFFYALIELPFTYKFAHNPSLRIDQRKGAKRNLPKMRRPSQRIGEILLYITPLLAMDLTMIKKFAGVSVTSIRASGNYAALPAPNMAASNNTSLPSTNPQISSSFLLPAIHNFTLTSPLQTTRALPPFPPTTRRLALEILFSFLIYDTLFFALHLALHRIPLLRPVHLAHHTHAEMHPQVTNRLSIPERLSLVLLANFSLNIIGAHVLTRTLFVPVFVYLLIEIHSGLDLRWGYEKIMPKGWGLGAREHAAHHRGGERGQGGYAPFFTWWDSALRWVEGGRNYDHDAHRE